MFLPYNAQARITPEGLDLYAELSFISGACKSYEMTISVLGSVPFVSQPLPLLPATCSYSEHGCRYTTNTQKLNS